MPPRRRAPVRKRVVKKRYVAKRKKAAKKKVTHRIKSASGFYPNVCKVRANYRGVWQPNTAAATYSNRYAIPINTVYKPLFFTDAGDAGCPPYLYSDKAMGAVQGAALLGSTATSCPYNRYKVRSCTITMRVMPVATALKPLVLYGFLVANPLAQGFQPTAPTFPSAVRQNLKYDFEHTIGTDYAMKGPLTIKKRYDVAKVAGLTKAQFNADLTRLCSVQDGVGSGGNGEYPVDNYWFNAKILYIDGNVPAANAYSVEVYLSYEVDLFQRNDLATVPITPSLSAASIHEEKDQDDDPPEIVEPPPQKKAVKAVPARLAK